MKQTEQNSARRGDYMSIKGIDVSAYNGTIDWGTVAAYGMDFAILRITEKSNVVDSSFERNYKGCIDNHIPVGVYKYSYALDVPEIQEEARKVLSTLNGRKLNLPVWLDLEWDKQKELGTKKISMLAEAFIKVITDAGYKAGIYCNAKQWYESVIGNDLKQKYDFWIASYPTHDDGTLQERLRPSYGAGWQYSSNAKIPGVPTVVDRSVFYKDYTKEESKPVKMEEIKVSKLQEFINLGHYYANNGGDKPYLEKRTEEYLDDFQKNAGYNNYTKFARDVNRLGQPGCQGQPWCAEYKFWELVQVLGITKALKIMGGGFYNCTSVMNHAKTNGTWHTKPKKGALVIFRRGAHIGSVDSYDENYVYTNEGNTSSVPGVVANGGAVRNKRYPINDSSITGYVWIDWGEETSAEKWVATGTRISTVDDLYVRESPNGYVLGQINAGDRVEIDGTVSGKWTKVKVANIGIGWAWTAYLQESEPVKPHTITSKQNKKKRLVVGEVKVKETDVRTWAGDEYPTIKKYSYLAKTNLVDVMDYTQKDTSGSKWYYVRIAGKYFGFVKASDIKKR